jgi:hypothetical protein
MQAVDIVGYGLAEPVNVYRNVSQVKVVHKNVLAQVDVAVGAGWFRL